MIQERVKRFEFQVTGRTFIHLIWSLLQIFNINYTGPDHLVIAISPLPGRALTNWNLLDHVPKNVQIWNSNVGERLVYFVTAAFGNGTMNFFLDINVMQSTLILLRIID